MKASPFKYVRAQTVEHALELLDDIGSEARLIAGGQSLVPMMAMRLSVPTVLIDINRIDHLNLLNMAFVNDSRNAQFRTGATLRQCELQSCAPLDDFAPVLARAMPWIGHEQIRNRGTVGGSLAQADPSAELPLVACLLDAQLELRSVEIETRQVAASEFFQGPLQTVISDTEMLVAIDWPVWRAAPDSQLVGGFDEVSIRHGDFAIASAACQLLINADGVIERAAFGLGGVDAVPRAFANLSGQLTGQTMTSELAEQLAHDAAALCDPGSDVHASAEYRRELARVLLQRLLLACSGQHNAMTTQAH